MHAARRLRILENKRLIPTFVVVTLALAVSAFVALDRPSAAPASRNVAAIASAERGALGVPAFVEFYSDECYGCRAIMGVVADLDRRYDGRVKFIYLDTDLPESQPYIARYDVRGMPTLALLDRRGQLAADVAGWPGEQAVAESLDKLLTQ